MPLVLFMRVLALLGACVSTAPETDTSVDEPVETDVASARLVYADRTDGYLWSIDRGPPTSLPVSVAHDLGDLVGVAWDGGDRLYTSSPGAGVIEEIALSSGAHASVLRGPDVFGGVAWDAGRLLVANTTDNALIALDPTDATTSLVAELPAPSAVAAIDGALFAGSATEPALYRVDAGLASIVVDLPWPTTLVVPADAGRVWVASGPDKAIALADPAAGSFAIVSRGLLGPAHGCADPAFPGRLVVGEVDGTRVLSLTPEGVVEVLAVSVASPAGCAGLPAPATTP